MFKKRNIVSKLWLKFTDRPAYKDYKWNLTNYRNLEYQNFVIGSDRLSNISKIKKVSSTNNKLTFTHSGNAGDVIYSLPTIKKIKELTGAEIHLYLQLNRPLNLPNYSSHPLGNVMLNQKMVDMLLPLLREQNYIDICEVYTNQAIDIDLDYFRIGLIPLDRGNIARWCSYITGVSPDLWLEWITVKADRSFENTVVLARSGRYQNKSIDYSFLQNYPDVVFIGVKSEYNDIKRFLPKIKWIEMEDFLKMAQVIAGCKLFIGNQSFPYSVAEALKVPRLLELSFEVMNVIPEGKNGHDFLFQGHLENLVNSLAGEQYT